MNWAEFFAMGGYGSYVWGSYGLAALVLAHNVILPLRHTRTVFRTLRSLHRIKYTLTKKPNTSAWR